MKWFQRQRMNWLADRLAPFQRKDLADAFDISPQQATKDIKTFEGINPGFWQYNVRTKHYERKTIQGEF